MSVRSILTWPDAHLTERCAPCPPGSEAKALAEDMLDTMYAAPGRGLAAPQIGVLTRLFVMDPTWKTGAAEPMIFLNPDIIWRSNDISTLDEGCLSLPGLSLTIPRPARISLHWQDISGKARFARFDGFAAACIQHEIDHLDGRMTLDHLSPNARADALANYQCPQ